MATDWLKVEKTTPRKPEVLRIATILDIHPDHAFGLCFRFWCWCDDNLHNSNGGGVSLALVDALVDRSGFSDALVKVGWLRTDGETFEISNFERHLSQSAKNRGLTAKRVARHDTKTNGASVSLALAELELDIHTKNTAPPVSETPAPAATKPERHGVWSWIKSEDLRDTGKLIGWHKRVSKVKNNPVIGPTESDRLNVVATAVHCWKAGDDPHKLFCWIIANKQFGDITAREEDTAHQMIQEYLNGEQEPTITRKGKTETAGEVIKGLFEGGAA